MRTMSALFERVIGRIYRLKIPFDTVYTSVFLVASESGAVLVDCATTSADVDGYILPALACMVFKITDPQGDCHYPVQNAKNTINARMLLR